MTIHNIVQGVMLDSPTLYTYLYDFNTHELLFQGSLAELLEDGKSYMTFASMRIGYDHDRKEPVIIIKGR